MAETASLSQCIVASKQRPLWPGLPEKLWQATLQRTRALARQKRTWLWRIADTICSIGAINSPLDDTRKACHQVPSGQGNVLPDLAEHRPLRRVKNVNDSLARAARQMRPVCRESNAQGVAFESLHATASPVHKITAPSEARVASLCPHGENATARSPLPIENPAGALGATCVATSLCNSPLAAKKIFQESSLNPTHATNLPFGDIATCTGEFGE